MIEAAFGLLHRFFKNRSGGVAIMAGFLVPIVTLGVIAAVDVTDMREDKRKMQDRVDAAVLFSILQLDTSEKGFSSDLQNNARRFVLDSVKGMGVDADKLHTNFYYDEKRDRVIGEVRFHSNAIFLGSSFMSRDVFVRAEGAPTEPTRLEMSLILDVSGSMNFALNSGDPAPVGSRRIDALRDGVGSLLDTIDEKPDLRAEIAVIPYATSVDLAGVIDQVGGQANSLFKTLDGSPLPNVCSKSTGKGKGHGFGLCKNGNNGNGGSISAILGHPSNPSPTGAWGAERYVAKVGSSFTLSLETPGEFQRVPVVSQPPRDTFCGSFVQEKYGTDCMETVDVDDLTYIEREYFAPRSGILGLTDDTDRVRTFMATLEGEGDTAGHIGTAWGLYALTPEWEPVFKHPSGEPDAFDSETKKVMVVMTDGQFKTRHDPAITVAETYDYFQDVCKLARSKGVTIYAVGLLSDPDTDKELKKCAGSSERYYPANSRSQLIEAFEDILENASRVRLSG